MYISDCIAYTDAKLSVGTCEELPRVSMKLPNGDEVAFTISRKQLIEWLESGKLWITENTEPDE